MNALNPTLSQLNPQQLEAVQHGDGAMLLLAGAGSGKTRVVTTRIAKILTDGASPNQILALTFTNKAAREMRARVATLIGGDVLAMPTISTFHALGAQFLREHATELGRTRWFSIYDDKDQIGVIQSVGERIGLTLTKSDARKVARAFDEAKNQGGSAENAELGAEYSGLDASHLGRYYEEALALANAFDFGDLIVCPSRILRARPKLCRYYQAMWRWVLVDEFQDTNRAQYDWLRLIAPPGSNLLVVGDDDQSIYGWRGAEVDNILGFADVYPGATLLRLEQNYRSAGHILRASNGVIDHNHRRLGKALWSERPAGQQVEIYTAEDGSREALWVVSRIRDLCENHGHAPQDFAILMRANHLSLEFETQLRRAGIAHVLYRGRAFFDRASIRDALAYARLVVNPQDDAAFRRAVNVPARGVGKTSLRRIESEANGLSESMWAGAAALLAAGGLRGKAKAGLQGFSKALESAKRSDAPPSQILMKLYREVGLLTEGLESARCGDKEREREENIRELLADLQAWEQQAEEASLESYLQQVKLISDLETETPDDGAVSLMTIHASKGLEFNVVFVVGLEEGLFPHQNAMDEGDVEEERRLCYVAMTRAKSRLFLSHARSRRTFGDRRYPSRSRFIDEIPSDSVHMVGGNVPAVPEASRFRRASAWSNGSSGFAANRLMGADESTGSDDGVFVCGCQVWHAQYGAGVVLAREDGIRSMVTVDFGEAGTLKVIADYLSEYTP